MIDSALGARGVEAYSKRTASGTAIGYPLYDAHGNNVATLTKGGSNSWSIGDTLRAYDAWGNVAGALGDPSGRYCANLGHVQDDESGLVDMRATYYEPGTGRFISEDPAMDGLNWSAYCSGDPVNYADETGKYKIIDHTRWSAGFMVGIGLTMLALCYAATDVSSFRGPSAKIGLIQGTLAAACVAFAEALNGTDYTAGFKESTRILSFSAALLRLVANTAAALTAVGTKLAERFAGPALAATTIYTTVLIGALLAMEND